MRRNHGNIRLTDACLRKTINVDMYIDVRSMFIARVSEGISGVNTYVNYPSNLHGGRSEPIRTSTDVQAMPIHPPIPELVEDILTVLKVHSGTLSPGMERPGAPHTHTPKIPVT